jgi:hypothetical protein
MNQESIGRLLARSPFVPFRIWMSNGRHYDVLTPYGVLPLPTDMIVGENLDPDFPVPVYSRASFINYAQINTIDPLPVPPPTQAPTPPAAA